MTKRLVEPNIIVDKENFTPEKTNDIFKEVEFIYETKKWEGALPIFLEKQGLYLTNEEFDNSLKERYRLLDPKKIPQWIVDSDHKWNDKTSATYKVLAALYSGKWECRVCGPVPQVNPQPAARLRDLKKRGYIIGSRRKYCTTCEKKTMFDILVMLPPIETRFEDGNELRKPMSKTLKNRIKSILRYREVCFNVVRSDVELLIDHKFPSQRWNVPETDNPNDMTEESVKNKFQLLSNQTNMWKSRYCDTCVKTGKRGDFMGLEWYYQGNRDWAGATQSDENGCKGCPWYDLTLWKAELLKAINK